MKFHIKIALMFSVLFLIMSITLISVTYRSSVKTIEEETGKNLESMTVNAVDKIDMLLYERIVNAKLVANDGIIGSRTSSPTQLADRLMQYRNIFRNFISLSFYDSRGNKVADSSGLEILEQHPLAAYWKETLKMRDVIIGLEKSESLGRILITFTAVVRDRNGIPIGAVVLNMPIERLNNILTNFMISESGIKNMHVELVNKDGLLIYSNIDRKGILKHKAHNWDEIGGQTTPGKKTVIMELTHHGEGIRYRKINFLARENGYMDFSGNNWSLIMGLPVEEVLTPANVLWGNSILILLISSAVSTGIILLFSSRITKAIKKLSIVAMDVAGGNLDVSAEVRSHDEIGQLAESFNKMISDLKTSRNSVMDHTNKLEDMVAHRTIELKDAYEQLTMRANALEKKNKETKLLSEMNNLHQISKTVEEALIVIRTYALQLFPDDSGELLMLDEENKLLESKISWGNVVPAHDIISADDCWAMRSGQAHISKMDNPDLKCKHVQPDSCVHICIPVLTQNEHIGIFHLITDSGPAKPFDDQIFNDKHQFALILSEQIGLSLSNIRLREKLHGMSIRDHLTGLFNRRYMEEFFNLEIYRANRKGSIIGVIMLDIDHFKEFNDTLGHDAGDVYLKVFSKFIRDSIRGSDVACRYGGEEFIIILPETTLEATRKHADYVRKHVKLIKAELGGKMLPGELTISCGVAAFPDHGTTAAAVIKAAYEALYNAKNSGRDRVCGNVKSYVSP